jgi:hypothetical protein
MDWWNNKCWSFSKGERRKITLKNFKNRSHSWIGHITTHKEFVINILEEAISGEKTAVGGPRLQYLKQVAGNTAAYSYTARKSLACDNSRWKGANQSEDWWIKKTDYPFNLRPGIPTGLFPSFPHQKPLRVTCSAISPFIQLVYHLIRIMKT